MYVVIISQTALDVKFLHMSQGMHVYEMVLTFTQVFNELIDLCYSFFS